MWEVAAMRKKKLLFCVHCFTRQSSRVHVLTSMKGVKRKKKRKLQRRARLREKWRRSSGDKRENAFHMRPTPGMTPCSRVDPFRILCVYLFIIHIISTSVFFAASTRRLLLFLLPLFHNDAIILSVRCTTGSNR